MFSSCAYFGAARDVDGGGGVEVNLQMARIVELILIGWFSKESVNLADVDAEAGVCNLFISCVWWMKIVRSRVDKVVKVC